MAYGAVFGFAAAAGTYTATKLYKDWQKKQAAKAGRPATEAVCPFTGARSTSAAACPGQRAAATAASTAAGSVPATSAPAAPFAVMAASNPAGSQSSSQPHEILHRPRRSFEHPVHYHSYLGLDQLLNAQHPLSAAAGAMAHDEMLFIITHQSHELWFKQVSHDLESVIATMGHQVIAERDLAKVIERLTRISKIISLLVSHLPILETMTPLSFLDFRDYLYPASGFQSMQFRTLEVRLGLRRGTRLEYAGQSYECALTPEQRQSIADLEKKDSLFDNVDRWLARLPVLHVADFDFWKAYQMAVTAMLDQEEKDLDQFVSVRGMDEAKSETRRKEIKQQRDYFALFWTRESYERSMDAGARRLSFKACQAALMINFYQEEPLFQVPFQLLTLLLEIDATLTQWRSKHAQMVHRMLGLKIGTGGSSGHSYLLATASKHKVFEELFNLASFMVPRFYLPPLPPSVSNLTQFHNFQDGCPNHQALVTPAPVANLGLALDPSPSPDIAASSSSAAPAESS